MDDFVALRSRLIAIAARDLADRTISPGEAGYLVALLDREPADPDGEAVPDDGAADVATACTCGRGTCGAAS